MFSTQKGNIIFDNEIHFNIRANTDSNKELSQMEPDRQFPFLISYSSNTIKPLQQLPHYEVHLKRDNTGMPGWLSLRSQRFLISWL